MTTTLSMQATVQPMHSGHRKTPPIPDEAPALLEESLQDLKAKLSLKSKSQDRKFVLKSMRECSCLRNLAMETTSAIMEDEKEWSMLETEVCSSTIEVNGIRIGPGTPASSITEVRRILSGLCDKLTSELKSMTSKQLYHALIIRLADSVSLGGALARLEPFLSTSHLKLQIPQMPVELPPTKITIYESGGQIHATCNLYHLLGLYRAFDDDDGRPWIKLTAAVHERSNLSTGASVRTLELRLPHK